MVAIAQLSCDGRDAGARKQGAPARSQALEAASGRSTQARTVTRPRGLTFGAGLDLKPRLALGDVASDALCVTRGELAARSVRVPTFRAVAVGNAGDGAAMKFVILGDAAEARALASGQHRRQVGLKLRAENGCNVVYVMWRLDPKPKLEVSVKRNPGARMSKECGARGYTKVKPRFADVTPLLEPGVPHELRAEIEDDDLVVWLDGRVAWQGTLPESVRELRGPAGVRSDNLQLELLAFSVDARSEVAADVTCAREEAGLAGDLRAKSDDAAE